LVKVIAVQGNGNTIETLNCFPAALQKAVNFGKIKESLLITRQLSPWTIVQEMKL
jgi:hypothetical protein